ncbi:MAG TPA: hypothetical protein VGS79_06195 [Puia sp.]|nr:hypothetical protein [Puia sp.]
MRFMLFPAVLCTLFISSPLVAQVVVCNHLYHDTIYVGTDNRALIKPVGTYYYATNMPADPQLDSELRHWVARGAGIDGLADSSMGFIKPRYTQFFSGMLAKNADLFNNRVMHGQVNITLGSVCFFGVDGGRPRLVEVRVYMNKGVKHPVVISFSKDDQPMAILGGGKPYPLKGVMGNAGLSRAGELKREIALWTGRNPVGAETGGPIDILVLSPRGGVWMRQ